MNVFWLGSGSGSGHVTLPIRRLVDASVQLVEKPGYQDSEVCVRSPQTPPSKGLPQLTNSGGGPWEQRFVYSAAGGDNIWEKKLLWTGYKDLYHYP